MRDLERNMTPIWYVNSLGKAEVISGGYHTGEYRSTFSTPQKTKLSLYPANNKIVEELFGTAEHFDMIASSTSLEFSKDTLIFLTEPLSNYTKTYDFSVHSISKSLNVTTYGLKRRV